MTDRPTQASLTALPKQPSPFQLNLEQQRKRARELQRAVLAGDATALARFRRHHPTGSALPAGDNAETRLSDAQLVIARELGLPSWPKLKAHIETMRQARDAIASGAIPDGDATTLHIRCGSDIQPVLKDAGFAGDFLEFSDAFCQGPVVDANDWLTRRAAFLAEAYGGHTGSTREQIIDKLRQAEHQLRVAPDHYQRIVLWFEHDSYDQLVLARCLSQLAGKPPGCLELVTVNNYPGSVRFVGLGQLPPEALRLLWASRQPVSQRQLTAGQKVWSMVRLPDPTPLATMANAGIPDLPDMARALHRHCQEFPWLKDGLSLTERIVLQLLAEGPKTLEEIFTKLMRDREPLPWLGDIMLWRILQNMKCVSEPVMTGAFNEGDYHWARESLTITDLGQAVLAAHVDFLSLLPPARWLGGVRIAAGSPCWRWDDQAGITVLL